MRSLARLARRVGSFKLRLAAYFLLLSLLPLGGALWAFSEVAARGETGRADARLNAAVRIAVRDYADRARQAKDTAASLARATGFQEAIAGANRAPLARLYREVPNAAFYADGRLVAGSPPPTLGLRRSAPVVDERGRPLGRVVVSVPLDDELVAALRSHPGFAGGDRLALLVDGRVIVGPRALSRVPLPFERVAEVDVGGTAFRALATRLSPGPSAAALVALAPREAIDAQAADLRRRLLGLAAVALAVSVALAYVLGRIVVRSLKQVGAAAGAVAQGDFSSRVPVRGRDEFASLGHAFNDMAAQLERRIEELASERGRSRDAIARFGDALAATHDPYRLLPVIVESIVEATGAAGARLIVDGVEIEVGDPDRGPAPLAIPLGSESGHSMLLLTPRDGEFGREASELAHWLASQARTALENASLHRRLEREAVTDGLTELPNRRQFEDSLALELSRAARFGGRLALIVADLDDFKQVNDRYGHLAGDDVLRAFASVLHESVREIDTAARYGGEEFAVLLPETDLDGAERVAERIRAAMASRSVDTFPGALLSVTASFGVAAYPEAPTQEALFAAADEALYRAKAGGKNQVAAGGTSTPVRPDA